MFDDDIVEHITYQANLYSVNVRGASIATTTSEIKDFISMLLISGIFKMPSYTDFWGANSRFPAMADVMPLKRFQMLRRYIHFADNSEAEYSTDRYFKVRPVMEKIRKLFLKIEHEGKFSIDEMMIPYKGTRAGNLRQYLPSKPHKWGFKFFVRAGVSGIVYDFLPYAGASTFHDVIFTGEESELGIAGKVVTFLCRTIQNVHNSKMYFDNFFTTFNLIQCLRNQGMLAIGTIRANRLKNVTMKSDKELLKDPRGTINYRTDTDANLTVVKWKDNKIVTLVSSFVGVGPLTNVKRYDKEAKAKVDVPAPNIVRQYNVHMGGVDLADMLCSLYRTPLKSRRWYLRIFGQMLNLCINNAWLLYRRDMELLGQGKYMSLKEFQVDVARAMKLKKTNRLSSEAPEPPAKIRRIDVPRPVDDMRYDGMNHWPIHGEKGRCRLCPKGWSRMKCSKCEVVLCFIQDRNCFVNVHVK